MERRNLDDKHASDLRCVNFGSAVMMATIAVAWSLFTLCLELQRHGLVEPLHASQESRSLVVFTVVSDGCRIRWIGRFYRSL